MTKKLDRLDHVAIPVADIQRAVAWYTENFACEIIYQDDTWAMLGFGNIRLAFVHPEQHPPHLAFKMEHAGKYGPLKTHRDGTRSTYIRDSENNAVEIMAMD